jgi:pyruvate/2-oxoglutarate dehydrogenase complex dihydrolipoamide dehydrogenase (E3) component
VFGGVTVGGELGEVFARFGVAVIDGADCMIFGEHPIASAVIESGFAAECITVHNGAHVSSIEQWGSQTAEILGDGAEVTGDKLLAPASTARSPSKRASA